MSSKSPVFSAQFWEIDRKVNRSFDRVLMLKPVAAGTKYVTESSPSRYLLPIRSAQLHLCVTDESCFPVVFLLLLLLLLLLFTHTHSSRAAIEGWNLQVINEQFHIRPYTKYTSSGSSRSGQIRSPRAGVLPMSGTAGAPPPALAAAAGLSGTAITLAPNAQGLVQKLQVCAFLCGVCVCVLFLT
jgi:hypothetical protein